MHVLLWHINKTHFQEKRPLGCLREQIERPFVLANVNKLSLHWPQVSCQTSNRKPSPTPPCTLRLIGPVEKFLPPPTKTILSSLHEKLPPPLVTGHTSTSEWLLNRVLRYWWLSASKPQRASAHTQLPVLSTHTPPPNPPSRSSDST